MKFLRCILFCLNNTLHTKNITLLHSNYGGIVLNGGQPCSLREYKNLEKQSWTTKKRKVVFLLVFNHLFYFFPLDGGCLVDYLECRNQSCRGFVSSNYSQKGILSLEVCSFSGLNGLLDIKKMKLLSLLELIGLVSCKDDKLNKWVYIYIISKHFQNW